MLTRGNCNSTQHPTDAKATSSCSHAIFQIFVKQQDRVPGLTQAIQVAKMSLIDLASSEQASSTHAKGERLREGANINRSLLALINVLNALADAKGCKTPVSYRDRDQALAEEQRDQSGLHISQDSTICQQLQAEVAALRKKLKVYEGGGWPPQDLGAPRSESLPQHQPCMPELPVGPGALQEESLVTEAQVERAMEGTSSDQEQCPKDQDEGPAEKVQTQMPEQNPTHALPESSGLILQPKLVMGHLSAQELDKDRSKQLALKMLCLAQWQYSLLQAANLLTPDMFTEFETLQQLCRKKTLSPGQRPLGLLAWLGGVTSGSRAVFRVKAFGIYWPCVPDHGKAAEWPPTHVGDSTLT
ncbi:Kinesin-like protein kif18b [Saguinus oedipus]|uniref:Kinesin-like protein kif18b n=1 Tax=Saguinus oedipus TaxID=9490 RepID=A0ABQ9VF62_SAGOE|nr:Kinesin-like protein kif18b [Saguinus oedipus]